MTLIGGTSRFCPACQMHAWHFILKDGDFIIYNCAICKKIKQKEVPNDLLASPKIPVP